MADAYIHSLTDLWNDAGTDYHAIKMNVTNSASSAVSKLLTLQVGGTDKFSVDKNGNVVAAGTVTTTGGFLPSANDAGALGASGTAWSDLFLASGGVINWNAGDVTATHSANALAFAGASSGYSFDAVVKPSANDAAALGASGTAWSDLFMASGAVIDFAAGNAVLTHSSGVLTLGTGDLRITTAGTDTASAVTVGGTQTLANKSFSTAVSISNAAAGTLLTLESTDAGASAGPFIEAYRNSASAAVSDLIGGFQLYGKDSAGNKQLYAELRGIIVDPTSGSESIRVDIVGVRAGTYATRLSIQDGVYTAGATGGDPGAGKVNATGFQKNGSEFGNDVADQVITGGARITSLSLGTITTGTVTPDPGDRPMQHYTNGGAHTLAPGSNNGFYTLDITNNGSAGAITTSGWTKVDGSFTTTNGHKFRCGCSIGDAGSLLSIQALQ